MTLEIKHEPEELIWIASRKIKTTDVPCPVCKGLSEVTVGENPYICKWCCGKGKVYTNKIFYSPKQTSISLIEIYISHKNSTSISYRTKVGSFEEDSTIYATKEECQKACDIKNQKENDNQ